MEDVVGFRYISCSTSYHSFYARAVGDVQLNDRAAVDIVRIGIEDRCSSFVFVSVTCSLTTVQATSCLSRARFNSVAQGTSCSVGFFFFTSCRECEGRTRSIFVCSYTSTRCEGYCVAIALRQVQRYRAAVCRVGVNLAVRCATFEVLIAEVEDAAFGCRERTRATREGFSVLAKVECVRPCSHGVDVAEDFFSNSVACVECTDTSTRCLCNSVSV